jgi:hypothetical protein
MAGVRAMTCTGRLRGRDLKKLKALVHYICSKCPDKNLLGATKLNKILWYADALSLETRGETITKETYIKRQFGPVPKHILEIIKKLEDDDAIAVKNTPFHNFEKREFVSLKRPDLSMFTPDEISLIDDVIGEICFNHTATSISLASHDRIWELAEIGDELPLETIFASDLDEVTEADVKWAKGALRKTA